MCYRTWKCTVFEVHLCIFQPRNVTGWGSEGVKRCLMSFHSVSLQRWGLKKERKQSDKYLTSSVTSLARSRLAGRSGWGGDDRACTSQASMGGHSASPEWRLPAGKAQTYDGRDGAQGVGSEGVWDWKVRVLYNCCPFNKSWDWKERVLHNCCSFNKSWDWKERVLYTCRPFKFWVWNESHLVHLLKKDDSRGQ